MIWVVLLSLVSFSLILFGCWLTVKRVRFLREDLEAGRVKAYAEMAKIAKEAAEKERTADSQTNS